WRRGCWCICAALASTRASPHIRDRPALPGRLTKRRGASRYVNVIYIHTARLAMSTAERMYDEHYDRWRGPSMRIHPAWIVLLILGFIVWWPVGLAILA